MAAAASDKVLQLDPKEILVITTDNPRFGAPADIKSLAESISAEGGVNTPVEVEKISAKDNGFNYKLTVGYRRHAAVEQLNAAGAGLMLPAVVRDRGDTLGRLKTQISENHDRRNLTPMDYAVAIKKLMDTGVPRIQIREMFPRATSAKAEGGEPRPASNAWLNMMLSFLALPSEYQTRIHDGRLPVKAAYFLTRVPPEKRLAVLENAEAEAEKEMKREQEEEKKFLEMEARAKELGEKEGAVALEIDAARTEAEAKRAKVADIQKAGQEAYMAFQAAQSEAINTQGKDKALYDAAIKRAKEANEKVKALHTDSKAAEKDAVSAEGAITKLEQGKDKVAKAAEEMRLKLEASRAEQSVRPKKLRTEGVTSREVSEAAVEEGAPVGVAKLNVTQIRKFVSEISLLNATYPKVAQIGTVLLKLFDGTGEPDSVAYAKTTKELAAIVGEFKAAPKTAPVPPTPPVPPAKKGKK